MNALLAIGIALISGYIVGKLIQKAKIPAVGGYIIAGLVIGKSLLHIVPDTMLNALSPVSDVALGLIAFSIGGELEWKTLKKVGKSIPIIAFFEAFTAFVFVTSILLIVGLDLPSALLLGAVSSATAPAATVMVLNELRAKGPLTSTLIAVVAIDDAICLMIYAIASSISKVLFSHADNISWGKTLVAPVEEIFFSLLLGSLVGIGFVFILKIVKESHEILVVAIGTILILSGIASKLGLSALLTCMAMGTMIANFSNHKRRVFSILDNISPPVYTAFFVLAGARLDVHLLMKIGLYGVVYTIFRILGKVLGASIGATISKSNSVVKKYVGFGLLSQVGVAVGLAMVIAKEFAQYGEIGSMVITILLATTVITELIGPLCTKYAVIKSGEVGKADLDNVH
ncbi:cation:proton antiporter [Defluviitalea phaphyphila]|uniref:cation:proton antiporter n=1 Tax=Defluviitalea phaphyphila TaxID=1473580 RepID=UPI00073100FA|nr:cation:proton antiporter [Defluviitalea phaphyphila]